VSGIKIVTIGGGSSYTPELVEGFIKRYDELPVRELWLVDIPEGEKKLQIVGALAKRMVEKAGVPMEVHLTLDRRKALEGADFVTTQMRVGLLDARIKDETIPLKYDVIGQETNGPGGLFKGLRTIPVILDICRDMEELCPDAWLINFTNPAGMVTEAVLRHTSRKKGNRTVQCTDRHENGGRHGVRRRTVSGSHRFCRLESYGVWFGGLCGRRKCDFPGNRQADWRAIRNHDAKHPRSGMGA